MNSYLDISNLSVKCIFELLPTHMEKLVLEEIMSFSVMTDNTQNQWNAVVDVLKTYPVTWRLDTIYKPGLFIVSFL